LGSVGDLQRRIDSSALGHFDVDHIRSLCLDHAVNVMECVDPFVQCNCERFLTGKGNRENLHFDNLRDLSSPVRDL